jgi:hypothetical protein
MKEGLQKLQTKMSDCVTLSVILVDLEVTQDAGIEGGEEQWN